VSDPENDLTGEEQATERLGPPVGADELMAQSRRRPPDLVGTRPEWDPDGLVPTETPRAASGRLWAPAGEGEEDDRETAGAGGTAATATLAAPAGEDDTPTYSRYSARFQFLLGALLAVGAAAVALLVAVVIGGKDDGNTIALRNAPAWSVWKPASPPGITAAQEIAKHVGQEYRQAGKQLALVDGTGLQIAGLPVTIAIQHPVSQGGDVDLVDDGVGVMYRMCGVDPAAAGDCRLAGKPSQERALLLRREALELALYSFRYLGVSETVVMMPPTTDQSGSATSTSINIQGTPTDVPVPSTTLLFRRNQPDVQAALNRPLTGTLSTRTPSVSNVTTAPDTSLVRKITDTKTYTSKFQPTNQDVGVYLVLAPIAIR
jgi:hypothetical protein